MTTPDETGFVSLIVMIAVSSLCGPGLSRARPWHGLRVVVRGGRWPGQDVCVMFALTMTPLLTV
jgi:hypothetical protein